MKREGRRGNGVKQERGTGGREEMERGRKVMRKKGETRNKAREEKVEKER